MTHSGRLKRQTRHAPLGQLFASDGTNVPVSITYNPEEILLVVLDGSEHFFEGPLTGLTLESTGPRGVLRTQGFGFRIDTNMLHFHSDADTDHVQRREFVRLSAAQRVILRDQNDRVVAMTLTVDISGGGMLIKLPNTLVIEEPVHFELFLGDDSEDNIHGTATVGPARNDEHRALIFTRITHIDRERLIRFIFDRQRRALAYTRGDVI